MFRTVFEERLEAIGEVVEMTFAPRMVSATEGFQPIRPLRLRQWDSVTVDLWDVECSTGAAGSYTSPDPRIFVTFDLGQGSFELYGEGGSATHQGPVSLSYVPANFPLRARAGRIGRFTHLDVHFSEKGLRRRFGTGFNPELLREPRLALPGGELGVVAGLLAEECRSETRLNDASGNGLLTALFARLFCITAQPHQPVAALSDGDLDKLTRFAMAGFTRTIRVRDLADLVAMPEASFKRKLKLATGLSPMQWLQELRIAKVQHILSSTDLALKDVTLLAGYADQAHLTRAFKAAVGVTPSEWRRWHRDTAPPPPTPVAGPN